MKKKEMILMVGNEFELLMNKAISLREKGIRIESKEKIEEAAEKFKELHQYNLAPPDAIMIENHIGLCYQWLKKYDQAEALFKSNLEWAREISHEGRIIESLRHLSGLYAIMGKHKLSVEYAIKAYNLTGMRGDKVWFTHGVVRSMLWGKKESVWKIFCWLSREYYDYFVCFFRKVPWVSKKVWFFSLMKDTWKWLNYSRDPEGSQS